ncbi:MAG TPA: sulfite exporter TauE/SafE family protein [Bdellovibrionales bacterium]|nr:sulfite exporter TauE/SafE family protein [Bdellovibrionales bacterium]
MELFGYAASFLMGITLGMIGGGGSILTVPILVYLFSVDPVLATAYSLFIVGLTALAGGVTYLKSGDVDLKTGVTFAIPSFIGVYLVRAFVVPSLPDPVFSLGSLAVSKALLIMFVFAVLMVAASFSMIRTPSNAKKKTALSPASRFALIAAEGLVVGGVTGFVGAGGGFLIIPALVLLVGLHMKVAVGTSLFIIAAKSLLGFIGDVQHQASIEWSMLAVLSAIAIAGLLAGKALSSKVSERALKKGFGWFVLVMGLFILFDQLKNLL